MSVQHLPAGEPPEAAPGSDPVASSAAPPRPSGRFSPLTALALLLLAGALLPAFWVRIIDSDVFMHLKAGELIWEMRGIPRTDPFSATARGREWIVHEWLWEAVAWPIQHWGGWLGLSVARLLCFAAALLLAMLAGRRRGASWLACAAAALVMLCPLMAFPEIRPQTVTFVFFSLVLFLLEAARARPRLLLALPPLTVLWANFHGAFLILYVLAAVTLGGWGIEMCLGTLKQRGRRGGKESIGFVQAFRAHGLFRPAVWLAATTAASLAGSLINPHGTALITYPVRVLGDETLRRGITEWLPPEASLPFLPFYLAMGAAAAAMIAARRATRPGDWIALGVFGTMSLGARRQICFFALALLPVLAVCLSALLARFALNADGRVRPLPGASLLAVCALFFAGSLYCYKGSRGDFGSGIQPGRFPERAAAILASSATGGTVLNDYADGGYLIWRLWPRWSVVIDGRADLYGTEVARPYARAWAGDARAAAEVLGRWGIDAVVGRFEITRLSPQRNLYQFLARSPDWSLMQWDDVSTLYVRRDRAGHFGDQKPFRRLHPALAWSELKAMQKSTEDWHVLAADLRRSLVEEPDSVRARQLLKRVEQEGELP